MGGVAAVATAVVGDPMGREAMRWLTAIATAAAAAAAGVAEAAARAIAAAVRAAGGSAAKAVAAAAAVEMAVSMCCLSRTREALVARSARRNKMCVVQTELRRRFSELGALLSMWSAEGWVL